MASRRPGAFSRRGRRSKSVTLQIKKQEQGGSTGRMLAMLMRQAQGRERVPAALPFPDRMKCILTYTQTGVLVNNSSSAGTQQFCGNDLFDPDFTGVGAQPMWFDQLSALYNRYRVYASACSVRFMCPTTTITTYGRVALCPSALTMASSAFADIESQPRAKFSTINVSGTSMKTLTNAFTTSEVLGVKDVEGSDRLQALVTASPSERWLWVLSAMSYDPGVTPVTVTYDARISYYVEFFDRKVVTLSTMANRSLNERKNERLNDAIADCKDVTDCKTDSPWSFVKVKPRLDVDEKETGVMGPPISTRTIKVPSKK